MRSIVEPMGKPGQLRLRSMLPLLLIVLAVLLASCAKKICYLSIANEGKGTISEVQASTSGGFSFRFGVIVTNTHAGYLADIKYSPADNLTLSWLDESNQKHEATIALASELPKGFSGELKLVIDSEGRVKARAP